MLRANHVRDAASAYHGAAAMTRRERLEAKIEKRQEWAAGRQQKAAAAFAVGDPYRGDHAFNTQPGHIPERARVIRAEDRGIEHANMAAHHESKATGLEAQLDRSVFSDDADAIEKLEQRVAEHEAQRDRMKRVNALFKKSDGAGLLALGIDIEQLRAELAAKGAYWGDKPHLPYELTNLGARIRDDRQRIKTIQERQHRSDLAEANGGVSIEGEAWVLVTFAEKPAPEILDALRVAGFRWSGGSWVGERAKLPEDITKPPTRREHDGLLHVRERPGELVRDATPRRGRRGTPRGRAIARGVGFSKRRGVLPAMD